MDKLFKVKLHITGEKNVSDIHLIRLIQKSLQDNKYLLELEESKGTSININLEELDKLSDDYSQV